MRYKIHVIFSTISKLSSDYGGIKWIKVLNHFVDR